MSAVIRPPVCRLIGWAMELIMWTKALGFVIEMVSVSDYCECKLKNYKTRETQEMKLTQQLNHTVIMLVDIEQSVIPPQDAHGRLVLQVYLGLYTNWSSVLYIRKIFVSWL